MGKLSKIQWTDSTFNPWIGCSKVGPGCDNCYAEAFAKRTGKDVWGAGKPRQETKGPWQEVRTWQRDAAKFYAEHGRQRRVFCASLADVFDNEVDVNLRALLFEVIEDCTDLEFLIVTKRIGNLEDMVLEARTEWGEYGFPANVGVMATIVNQNEANRDIPKLLDVKSAFGIAWVGLSMEPLLGPVQIADYLPKPHWNNFAASKHPDLDWVITGGESGPKRRAFDPDWARSLRDQCKAAGTAFFMKQMSALRPDDSMIPADLMVREWPEAL